jgi:hypothetical protein
MVTSRYKKYLSPIPMVFSEMGCGLVTNYSTLIQEV